LGRALWTQLQPGAARIVCPGRVLQVEAGEDAARLQIDADGETLSMQAKLVVAADGAHSAVREALGVGAQSRDYHQTAVITTVLPKNFHDHVAYERFTADGPLALLPLEDGRCTLVMTLSNEAVVTAMAWSDQEFLAELQRRFGFRLGRFIKVGKRAAYPLYLSRAQRTSAPRCAIIGNAAQGLHPVAGMGFNLGLRDAACLAELIAERCGSERFDSGERGLLNDYDAWRAADRAGVIAFTDGLVRTFSNPLRLLGVLRNLGLLAFDLMPPAKAALSRLSTGATGRVPKLARGVTLSRAGVPP
jgi:2-octaprenyl-6-methoxyphenol hydroxylase